MFFTCYLCYYSLLISRLIFANVMDFLENMLCFIKYKRNYATIYFIVPTVLYNDWFIQSYISIALMDSLSNHKGDIS